MNKPKQKTWDESFADYADFVKNNGREPTNKNQASEGEMRLARWGILQRKPGRLLSTDKISKLDSINFRQKSLTPSWDQLFSKYRAFGDRFGREPINSNKVKKSEKLLSIWASGQRLRHKQGKLSAVKLSQLQLIGFRFDNLDNPSWLLSLNEYKNFYIKNGRWPSYSDRSSSHRVHLDVWATTQRHRRNTGQLSDESISALNNIGFLWKSSRLHDLWFANFADYRDFLKTKQREPLVVNYETDHERKLGVWASMQRQAWRSSKKRGRLQPEFIEHLDKIEFAWHPRINSWEIMFQAYLEFIKENGKKPRKDGQYMTRGRPPKNGIGMCREISEHEKKLANWAQIQKTAKLKGVMPADRLSKLIKAGFFTGAEDINQKRQRLWDKKVKSYALFIKKNSRAPSVAGASKEKKLAAWACTQCRVNASGKMLDDRIKKLNAIHFEW